ncbi:unnamed protein product, partial [Mesorhabditis spiculigera]
MMANEPTKSDKKTTATLIRDEEMQLQELEVAETKMKSAQEELSLELYVARVLRRTLNTVTHQRDAQLVAHWRAEDFERLAPGYTCQHLCHTPWWGQLRGICPA